MADNEFDTDEQGAAGAGTAGLVVDPESDAEQDEFEKQLEATLKETEAAVLGLQDISKSPDQARHWQQARNVVTAFRPVPWFIWRLANFVFARNGPVEPIPEGFVYGLRRLMFAAASDEALGIGQKVNKTREAFNILPPDVIAATSVIHAIARRLASKPFERIWRPILDDALLRARIGLEVGLQDESFGPGRAMIAGFAGRCGLAVLISSGELEDARRALEMLATGAEIRDVGLSVYKCDPLQVSAMTISASGCGRDAAFGTVSYASLNPMNVIDNDYQMKWLAAFTICESVRTGRMDSIDSKLWSSLQFDTEAIDTLGKKSKMIIRRGHGWQWLMT